MNAKAKASKGKQKQPTAAKKASDENQVKVDDAIAQIRERFGDGSIMKLGTARAMEVASYPTGSPSLDIALGVRGIPQKRIIEIFGPESSGKTTLSLHVVANVQKQGGVCAFVDAEHALDPDYAARIGVDTKELLVSQPDTGEQALEIVETLVRSNAVDLVVVDSVAALVPRAEIDGDMGDSHMGLQARLMSQALRKLTAAISKSSATVIFLNQLRMKIGVVFGNPETTTGGNALKFYSSVRIEVRRSAQIKKGDQVIGNQVKVKVVKNKVAPPFQTTTFDIMYNEGISREGDLVDIGVQYDVIQKSGSWFAYDGEKIAQGREAAKRYLKDNPKIADTVEQKVWDKVLEERKAAAAE